ncbi:MAG: phage tail tube protein [Thaumarchaeota archaeon]|nr:phage tail tube protein [Candidatus Calditenuaceae archaeon]MDW8042309.1 phage tail tube protein [Nitrososphaerota archaeon]
MRYVGVGRESSQGNPVSPQSYMDPRRVEASPIVEDQVINTLSSRFPKLKHLGGVRVEGEIEGLFGPDSFSMLVLSMVLGKVQSTASEGYSVHNFSPLEIGEVPNTYTVELCDEGIARVIVGAFGDSMELNLRPDEPVSASLSFLALNELQGTPRTPTFSRVHPVRPEDVVCLIGGQAVELDELTLKLENDLSTDHYTIGSRTLPRHELGEFSVAGTFSARFRSRSHLDRFLNGQETSLSIRMRSGTVAAGIDREVVVELPRVYYSTWSCEVVPSERSVQEVEFRALATSAGDPPVRFRVQTEEQLPG